MNTHLKEYLKIYIKFPLGNYFTKEQRKIRHEMISNWEKSDLIEFPTLDEFINFVKENLNIIQITPQFFKKFKVVWQDDLENGYKFAEFILEMNLEEIMWAFDISSMQLVKEVLNYNPNHLKALKLKLKTLVRYHQFCLHEIPFGVLVEGSLEEELKSVEEMKAIAEKLNFNDESFKILLSNCKTYYPLWFEYLKINKKEGFENFLKEKEIRTEKIVTPYIII